MRRQTLIVMVKEPRPGRVKTRLGRDIGMVGAAWWYRHQCRRLLRQLRDPRWDIALAVSPDREGLASRVWPDDVFRIPQGKGNLGKRMARALSITTGPSVLIGSDVPGVRRGNIADAFRGLGSSASVIGPAPDGGYWLVGLKHPSRLPKNLFCDVRWSTEHALEDTMPTLPKPVWKTGMLSDVDTVADLKGA